MPIEPEEIKNQTQSDAYQRLFPARLGFLAHNPSIEYLDAMKMGLYAMLQAIDDEIYWSHIRKNQQEQADNQ